MKLSAVLVLIVILEAEKCDLFAASTDRFKGASFDGYACSYHLHTYTADIDRFKGNLFDGYACSFVMNSPVTINYGTIISIR